MKDRKFNIIIISTISILTVVALLLVLLNNLVKPHISNVAIEGSKENAYLKGQIIQITFSHPMDRDSFKGNVIVESLEKYQYQNDVALSWSNLKLNIALKNNLLSNTRYRLTIKNSVKDMYGVNIKDDFTYEFKTKSATLTFLEPNYLDTGNPDRIIESDPEMNSQNVLFEGENITNFDRNEKYLIVVLQETQNTDKIIVKNLHTGSQKDINIGTSKISKIQMSTLHNEFIFTSQELEIKNTFILPITGFVIKKYNIDLDEFTSINPNNSANDVLDFVLSPDEQALLYRGDNSIYYLVDLTDQNNLITIGKFIATGGFNSTGDQIIFLNYNIENTSASFPVISIYYPDRNNLIKSEDDVFSINPTYLNNTNSFVYAEFIKSIEGAKGIFRIIEVDENGNRAEIAVDENQSLELPRISGDDRYIVIERYTQGELLDYKNLRTYVFETKPYKARLLIYDRLEKKLIDRDVKGTNAKWLP